MVVAAAVVAVVLAVVAADRVAVDVVLVEVEPWLSVAVVAAVAVHQTAQAA